MILRERMSPRTTNSKRQRGRNVECPPSLALRVSGRNERALKHSGGYSTLFATRGPGGLLNNQGGFSTKVTSQRLPAHSVYWHVRSRSERTTNMNQKQVHELDLRRCESAQRVKRQGVVLIRVVVSPRKNGPESMNQKLDGIAYGVLRRFFQKSFPRNKLPPVLRLKKQLYPAIQSVSLCVEWQIRSAPIPSLALRVSVDSLPSLALRVSVGL